MSIGDNEFLLDEDYLNSLADDVSGGESHGDTGEQPRSGLFWVRKHDHVVVGDGAGASPSQKTMALFGDTISQRLILHS